MITLGITGGIGSGKTTVCRLFEELGARVFYADLEAKKLMVEDPEARAEIIEAFGSASYNEEGQLNRGYLAQQVFGDEKKVQKINAIVHPRVHQAFKRTREQAEQDGIVLLLHEAALIFESGGDKHLDAVVVVDAPETQRVQRVVERDGVMAEQVRSRMHHQLSSEERRRRADYIIENTGTLEDLRRQVEALFESLTRT